MSEAHSRILSLIRAASDYWLDTYCPDCGKHWKMPVRTKRKWFNEQRCTVCDVILHSRWNEAHPVGGKSSSPEFENAMMYGYRSMPRQDGHVHGKPEEEDSPWQQNAIRAMEGE